MIAEFLTICFFLILGLISGGLYFFGLWNSVRQLPHQDNRLKSILTGYGLRLALLLIIFTGLIIAKAEVLDISLWLIGFVSARYLVIRKVRLSLQKDIYIGESS